MISYKKIDLLNLHVNLIDGAIYYKNSELVIKSPIINYDIKDETLILKINDDSDAHVTFIDLCSYIERLFKNAKIKTDIIKNRNDINNRNIAVSIRENCKFFDTEREEIFGNNIKSSGKIMCSILCKNGKFSSNQLLQIK
jgi:hypothetical protein